MVDCKIKLVRATNLDSVGNIIDSTHGNYLHIVCERTAIMGTNLGTYPALGLPTDQAFTFDEKTLTTYGIALEWWNSTLLVHDIKIINPYCVVDFTCCSRTKYLPERTRENYQRVLEEFRNLVVAFMTGNQDDVISTFLNGTLRKLNRYASKFQPYECEHLAKGILAVLDVKAVSPDWAALRNATDEALSELEMVS